ncbi:predicted protein [Plenodomus lingam JN3]|uniref:Predicted protein n=1 Tax=Leptosphaeria maculans (strain JN3 / isolate v23.1.3 / race Av1-4-5-6-7-8) TaxID=985895 RepID=E5A068_LEPMJ|nr:predicted protein [Plenodomus lingam JN3]CBX96928.1 predicted protein [Plenodomus lingam JN3]
MERIDLNHSNLDGLSVAAAISQTTARHSAADRAAELSLAFRSLASQKIK